MVGVLTSTYPKKENGRVLISFPCYNLPSLSLSKPFLDYSRGYLHIQLIDPMGAGEESTPTKTSKPPLTQVPFFLFIVFFMIYS